MARKPGKPIVRKRTTKTKPKPAGKADGGKIRRGRVVAEPVVADEPELELDSEAGADGDKDRADRSLRVSSGRQH